MVSGAAMDHVYNKNINLKSKFVNHWDSIK